jgi:CHASE1-domain containing sensor protein
MRFKPKDQSRPIYSIPLVAIAASTLIIGGGFLTATAYTVVRQQIAKQTSQKFEEITAGHAHELTRDMDKYTDAVYATKGLFAAAQVDAAVWDTFIRSQSSLDRYAGMKAIGYAEIVPQAKIGSYEQTLRATQHADITIHPAKNADEYVVLTYHQDMTEPNTKQINALGFDLASSPERYNALELAKKTGVMTATGRVELATNGQPGFLLILPLTNRFGTSAQSQQPFGYAIAAFEFSDLIDGTIGARLDRYHTSVSIEDVTNGQTGVLYSKEQAPSGRTITRSIDMLVADRTWRITFEVPESSLLIASQRWAPEAILVIGAGFTLIICSLSYSLKLRSRLKYNPR